VKRVLCFLSFISLWPLACFAQKPTFPCSFEGELRQKGLYRLDEAMSWAAPFSSRVYSLKIGSKPKIFKEAVLSLEEFVLQYGYFSCQTPLVGIVTEESSDLALVQKALEAIISCPDPRWGKLATEEILAKVLAYRHLEKGMKITIPVLEADHMRPVLYEVDHLFDLWQGMPAFGLLPLEDGGKPILLFRGTDFSLVSKRSWASVLSDFDFAGAGFSAFSRAKEEIQTWLDQASSKGKAKVLGFSLGGALAIYAALYHKEAIEECIAFNPPGVSKAVFSAWGEGVVCPITLYITQGDIVPKVGKLIGSAFELCDKKVMGPIEAHTKLMSASSPLFLFSIHLEEENRNRL
jgi:hypothetical protein